MYVLICFSMAVLCLGLKKVEKYAVKGWQRTVARRILKAVQSIFMPKNLRGILDLVASERRGNDGNKDNEHEGDGAHCAERQVKLMP